MRQLGFILFTFLIGCSPGTDTKNNDSKGKLSTSVSTLSLPDSTFKDFLSEFCFNEDFQKSRIKFPLSFNNMGRVSTISLNNWKHDPIYVNLEAVTDVWNGEKTDEKSNERVFTWIRTQDKKSKNYYFIKENKFWFLDKIEIKVDSSNVSTEDFYSFLGEFCNDSIFQSQRIKFPLDMTYLNEDLTDHIKEKREREKWSFTGFYYNCDSIATTYYNFQQTFIDTDERVLIIQGIGNGINSSYTFKRIDNKWVMIKYEDYST